MATLKNWKKGRIVLPLKKGDEAEYRYEAVVFDEVSKYGINGGRVSKLYMYDESNKCLCNYDREWDIKPVSDEARYAVDYIVNIVYGETYSEHRRYVYFIINDWLEAEFSDEGDIELQNAVREIGLNAVYEAYMASDEMFVDLDNVSSIIKNILERTATDSR